MSAFQYPETIIDMIKVCWSDDPEKRPTFEDILEYLSTEAKLEVKKMAGRGESFSVTRRGTSSTSKLAGLVNQMYDEEEGRQDTGKRKGFGKREDTIEVKYERLKAQFDKVAEELNEKRQQLQNFQNHNLAI